MQLPVPLKSSSVLPWEDSSHAEIIKLPKKIAEDLPLSIVMPVYNSGKYLERAIRSILHNDLTAVDVIICDNESTDDTREIIHYYRDVFAQIVIKKDKGQSDALNNGFSKAKGEILGWLNGDDILLPNALTFVRKTFWKSRNLDFCVGDAFLVEEDLSIISRRRYTADSLAFSCLIDYAFNHLIQPSVFFSRNVWNQCGPLDIRDHYAMDADLFISMSKEFAGVAIGKPLAYSVYHEQCKTRANRWDSIVQLSLVQAKHGGFLEAKKTLSLLKDLRIQIDLDIKKNVKALDQSLADTDVRCAGSSSTFNKYRVALVATSISGGAGIACKRMHRTYIEKGLESDIFAIFTTDSEFKEIPLKNDLLTKVENGLNQPQSRREVWQKLVLETTRNPNLVKANEIFSHSDSCVDWERLSLLLSGYDIIHFHWTPGLIDYEVLSNILPSMPLVITLHDMNHFTGGCHYSEGCNNFASNCENCPQLLENKQLASFNLQRKISYFNNHSNVNIIAPSGWMKGKALDSITLKDKPVHLINNFIDLDKYKPQNQKYARLKLGLDINKKLILIGAESITNKRKGGHLLEALDRFLQVDLASIHDYELVLFGRSTLPLGSKVTYINFVDSDKTMNLLYSACDCFCLLSLEENAPQVVSESLLSGCPVVSFPVGNLPDIITNKLNGHISPLCDLEDMCSGIHWIFDHMNSPHLRVKIAIAARNAFCQETTFNSHLNVYESAISAIKIPAK